MTHLYRAHGVPKNMIASFEYTLRKGRPPQEGEDPYMLDLDRPQYISTQSVREALGWNEHDADAGIADEKSSVGVDAECDDADGEGETWWWLT